MAEQNNAVATADKGKVTYLVAGENVTLSYNIVRNFLTKGNGKVTDQDLTQFISICKYNQLNPFLNEAYLVKFGEQPAQMIVSKEAFLKRAENCEEYEGFQAGIIVKRGGEIVELEGCFYEDSDELVGGWGKVYRKDRKFPFVSKVRLSEYDKKQSIWKEKQSTMISKVAKVQALREAFPTQLGAMYTQEESNVVDISFEDVTVKMNAEKAEKANVANVGFEEKAPEEKQTSPEANVDSAGQAKMEF